MANDGKRGFFSSLFGKRKLTEQKEMEELESRRRLEERIQQALAERAAVSELLMREEKHMEENQTALAVPEEEAEVPVELFPISASALIRRKAPVQAGFWISGVDEVRSYAANER
jgi:hypothetical protein